MLDFASSYLIDQNILHQNYFGTDNTFGFAVCANGNHLAVLCHNAKRAPHAMRKDTIMMPPGFTKDALLPFTAPPDIWPPIAQWGSDLKLSYPMHCHAEMSQTAGGGLYPNGMLAHWEVDR